MMFTETLQMSEANTRYISSIDKYSSLNEVGKTTVYKKKLIGRCRAWDREDIRIVIANFYTILRACPIACCYVIYLCIT